VHVWRLVLAAFMVVANGAPSLAVDTTLMPATVSRAIAQGRALAAAHRGFVVAPYLLFGVDDAALVHDEAPVEGIELATPFEAVRYRGFLSGFESTPMSAAAVAAFVADARTHVDVLVYAHSRNETDRAFIAGFGPGELQCADGTRIAADLRRGPPIRDVYLDGTTPTYRWRGQLDYRFAMDATLLHCDPATIIFTDDRARAYRFPIDLALYE
jgi:hypothetical protein